MVTSVAVLVAMVKFVKRLVDFISLCRVMTDLHRFYATAVPEWPPQRQLAGVIIHVSVMHCNVTRHV